MKRSTTEDNLASILAPLHEAQSAFAAAHPGESGARQPVHTVYGGAHLFQADTVPKLGLMALRTLEQYAPNFVAFARVLGLEGADELPKTTAEIARLEERMASDGALLRRVEPRLWLAHVLYQRVIDKLRREAVEDYRIDFEDGFGNRPDAEEDSFAELTAYETAKALSEDTLSPFFGIRIKPLSGELHARAVRTLDIFVSTLASGAGGKLPERFVVTLPKVVDPAQVTALVDLFELLERETGLEPGTLKLELMVETPQSFFDAGGRANLPLLVAAARGRCTGAHFGVYDYTASLQITAEHQHMTHFACDVARNLMQINLAGTGVTLSDGATNVLPVGPHRRPEGGQLSLEQQLENRRGVHAGWRLHYRHVRHSLEHAFYQGWDLHPAQLPTRYAALHAFFLEHLDAASKRLKTFVDQAAQATLVGDVFDDAATGQGLLNFFLRGLSCGAITVQEALRTGLTLEELRGRSFLAILRARREGA